MLLDRSFVRVCVYMLLQLAAAAVSLAPAPSLQPLAYKPLRLGTVSASGWLLGQLKQQAATLSGHLDLFWCARPAPPRLWPLIKDQRFRRDPRAGPT